MLLKNYQLNAIDDLLTKAKKLLSYSESKKLIFKAPTASGKTIMMAEFLKRLCEDKEVKSPLSFIWTAPRQLHLQSKAKLEKYYESSRTLECLFFEDLDDKRIGENEILFFNWESINKEDNLYIKDNEEDNNLSNIISRTKEEGQTVILIIDESHHHATSEISQDLIRDIGPQLTIEVSATPTIEIWDEIVTVQLEDVKAEGMIKKAVRLNEGFENVLKEVKVQSTLSGQSEDLVIDVALKKRKALKSAYEKEKTAINPLVLIQLPDRKTSLEDVIKDKVIAVLKDKYKITTENGKLAIYLSEDKENLENISKPDNEAEVLIFKQAIALGWDCPRAQILVLFRNWHSFVFSVQTVGRIMRMPEPNHGHYTDDEILNYGYVFTNLSDIEIKEDIGKNYITIYTARRRADYSPIDLVSCHSKRHRERTRLSPVFIKVFMQEAEEYKLARNMDKNAKGLDARFISDYQVENVDALTREKIEGKKTLRLRGLDLQKCFDSFVSKHLTPFYPEARSIGRLKEAIYHFFEHALDMKYEDDQSPINEMVLNEDNRQHFINVIEHAKEKYMEHVAKLERGLDIDECWNVPPTMGFGADCVTVEGGKSIMQPLYNNGWTGIESAFIGFLESSGKVAWWFKNRDRDSIYFAVPYEEDGERKPFYVDFIVQFKDGAIGLFDTKSGLTKQVAGPKAAGLREYMREQNKKGKKLFGGIVTNTEPRNYRGRWVYFDKDVEELTNSLDNWTDLIL